MKDCKECELAIYCYSDSSTWIFRTKQEMSERQAAIEECPHYKDAPQASFQKSTKEA
jgi:hypothetical protein